MEINNDGSMIGKSFSGENYTGGYPTPEHDETYREYKERVDKLVKEHGFHLGDLTWSDWSTYCMGSGQYELYETQIDDFSGGEEITVSVGYFDADQKIY